MIFALLCLTHIDYQLVRHYVYVQDLPQLVKPIYFDTLFICHKKDTSIKPATLGTLDNLNLQDYDDIES